MIPIFLTSDTHYQHSRIVELCHRPFKTVDEMNEELIRRFNSVVPPNGVTYHLGDFSLGGVKSSLFRRRLNGMIHLIKGNHDNAALREPELWASIRDVAEFSADGQRFFLSHYAHRIWNKSHHGVIHCYGHSHGGLADDPNALSLDVGVDCWDYYPVSIVQIKARMAKKMFVCVDHHGKSEELGSPE